jgi:hypothetical protein
MINTNYQVPVTDFVAYATPTQVPKGKRGGEKEINQ